MKKTAKSSELSEVKMHEPNDKKRGDTPITEKVKTAKKSGATLPHKSSVGTSRTKGKGDRVGKRLADAIAIEVADTDLSAIMGGAKEAIAEPEKGATGKKRTSKRGAKKAVEKDEALLSPEIGDTDSIAHPYASDNADEVPTVDIATSSAEEATAELHSDEVGASAMPNEATEEIAVSESNDDTAGSATAEIGNTEAVTESDKTPAEKKKKKKISTAARGATDIELNAEEKKTPTANVKKKKKRRSVETELAEEASTEEIPAADDVATKSAVATDISDEVERVDDGDEYAEISGDPVESYDPFASLSDEEADAPEIELFPSELTPYEDDEIVDTHESAEEAASYEAFVQNYQATIQEMLRRAAEKEYNKDENGNPQLTIEADDELDELFEDDIGDEDDETLDEILVSEDTAGNTDDEDEEYLSGEDYEAILKASENDASGALTLEDILIAETESEELARELEDTDAVTVEETAAEQTVPYTDEESDGEEHVLYIEKHDETETVDETAADADDTEDATETDVEALQIRLEDTESGAAVLDISVHTEYTSTPAADEASSEETPDESSALDEDEDTGEGEQIAIELVEEASDTEEHADMEYSEDEYEDETPPAYNPDKPRFIDTVFEILELFVFTLVAVMVITSFFLRHSIVDGSSMQHTLEDKDILLISDFLYTPERGDIIVFADYEKGQHEPLVKRVIGIEGDVVEVTDDYLVYVNGELLDEDYVLLDEPYFSAITGTWQVGEGELFVLGDHRSISLDSRAFGVVSEDCVLGKVLLRLYPFDSFGTVD